VKNTIAIPFVARIVTQGKKVMTTNKIQLNCSKEDNLLECLIVVLFQAVKTEYADKVSLIKNVKLFLSLMGY
jgi:hypothetical protein